MNSLAVYLSLKNAIVKKIYILLKINICKYYLKQSNLISMSILQFKFCLNSFECVVLGVNLYINISLNLWFQLINLNGRDLC